MKEIVIVSGKGGTGKTSFVASFAQLATEKIALGDCDVDAANLALLVHGSDIHEEPFYAGQKAQVDADNCIGCGLCTGVCRYNAIPIIDNLAKVKTIACEGCRACSVVCPVDAITFKENRAGTLFIRETSHGPMVHGALGIAQDNSGKLAAKVRSQTKSIAEKQGVTLSIFDGPPGIGCPVHAAIGGVDLVVAVTEPSSSGLHDLERMLDLCEHFKLKAVVIINKFDLSLQITEKIERVLKERKIKILGKVLFDEKIPVALSNGETLNTISSIQDSIKQIWLNLHAEIY